MQTLGKFEQVSERVAYLAKHRMPLMRRVVRCWGVPAGTENDIVADGIANISKMKPPDHLTGLLQKKALSDRDLHRLDHELIKLITTPEYRYYPAVRNALDDICKHRGQLLRHASRFVRYELCEDAVNGGTLAFWTRKPEGDLAHKLRRYDTGNQDFLDSVRAVLMTYIEYSARQLKRKFQPPIDPSDTNAISEPDHLAELRIAGDTLIRGLRASGKITKRQEAFWFWRREHPDGPQQEFDLNLRAVEIARLKKELMEILMDAMNRECRKPGEEL